MAVKKIAMNLKIYLIFISLLSISECSKILIIHTSLSRSHVIPLQELAKVLAQRNHEVTFVSSFPLDKTIKNYRDIAIPVDKEHVEIYEEFTKVMGNDPDSKNFLDVLKMVTTIIYNQGENALQSNEIKKLLKSNEKFDLVITGYFLTEYLLGFADHFKCPSIVFSSANLVASLHKMVGNPLSVSGTPHILSGSSNMDFMSRVKNFIINGIDLLIFKPLFTYKSRQIYE